MSEPSNLTPGKSGADILLDVLQDEGITKIFGNPGSTEMPLMDALVSRPEFEYVLALQEASAVGMADGYAQAGRRAAFVNLHTAGGIGNAMGALVNAKNTNTPLVVTAGQQDTRHLFREPWLAGNLVELARPVTKWAHELQSADDIAAALRRAFAIANAHPRGPVFLSLPMNLLDEPVHVPVVQRSAAPLAAAGNIRGLLDWLKTGQPQRIALLLSDTVVEDDAVTEAVAAAEAIAADVYGTPLLGGNAFPTGHVAWRGVLPPDFQSIRNRLSDYDAVILVGDHALLAYPYKPVEPVPSSVTFIQISASRERFGFDSPVDIAIEGYPKPTLAAIAAATAGAMRWQKAHGGKASERARLDAALAARLDARAGQLPLHPSVAVNAVLAVLPQGVPIVNEAPSTFDAVREQLRLHEEDRYYFVRGGALGFGMPAAVGVSLLGGGQCVACFIGDGAAMYSPQALWSAKRYRTPVVFLVFNNRKYDILMRVAKGLGSPNAVQDKFVGMTIDEPAIDFAAFAKVASLQYFRFDTVDGITKDLPAVFALQEAAVVEIAISGV